MKSNILDAIATLDEIKGKTDIDTYKNISLVIDIMEGTTHKQWPSTNLCKVVYRMEDDQKKVFLDVMKDMKFYLTEAGYNE